MNKLHTLPLLFAASLACIGCSDDDSSDVTVSAGITVNDWLSGSPVQGAEVCGTVGGTEIPCETTNSEGYAAAKITNPTAGTVVQTRVSAEGYFPFLIETIIPENPVDTNTTWVAAADGVVATLTDALGTSADPAKGHFTVLVTDGENPIQGATVKLTGGTAEHGPNYLNSPANLGDGIFAMDAKTTDAGLVAFNNVDTGAANAEATVDGKTCTVGVGLVGSNAGEAIATIKAGFVTYTTIVCQ